MEPFLFNVGMAALAELGDKSQFMLFVLSFRFRHEIVSTILGMSGAMIVANGLAGVAGAWIAVSVDPNALRWTLVLLFFCVAILVWVPDAGGGLVILRAGGVVLTVFMSVFLAELGDRSLIAKAALSAEQGGAMPLLAPIFGSIAINIPVVLAGPKLAETLVARGISLQVVSSFAVALFGIIGTFALLAHYPLD
jgi:putative Ca2+/H+ antiporter (TMEM165/GDT1 family)